MFDLSWGFTGNKLAADLEGWGMPPQERRCARSGTETAGHLPCPDLQATCCCQVDSMDINPEISVPPFEPFTESIGMYDSFTHLFF